MDYYKHSVPFFKFSFFLCWFDCCLIRFWVVVILSLSISIISLVFSNLFLTYGTLVSLRTKSFHFGGSYSYKVWKEIIFVEVWYVELYYHSAKCNDWDQWVCSGFSRCNNLVRLQFDHLFVGDKLSSYWVTYPVVWKIPSKISC